MDVQHLIVFDMGVGAAATGATIDGGPNGRRARYAAAEREVLCAHAAPHALAEGGSGGLDPDGAVEAEHCTLCPAKVDRAESMFSLAQPAAVAFAREHPDARRVRMVLGPNGAMKFQQSRAGKKALLRRSDHMLLYVGEVIAIADPDRTHRVRVANAMDMRSAVVSRGCLAYGQLAGRQGVLELDLSTVPAPAVVEQLRGMLQADRCVRRMGRGARGGGGWAA